MPILSLPLSFTNSFWSQDYRRGIELLFQKLEHGAAENDQIISFIRARGIAEAQLAATLTSSLNTGPPNKGFGADDGASLLMAFRGLQTESVAQGKVHDVAAKELTSLVVDPFSQWAQGYKERLKQSKATVLDNWLRSYEQAQTDVHKLKQQYLTKTRRADDAEDDARFAPNTGSISDKYTISPRLLPADTRHTPQRTSSVSERITQRLREIQKKGAGALSNLTMDDTSVSPNSTASVDKGKGKATDQEGPSELASPLSMSPLPPPKAELPSLNPEPMVLGGIPFAPAIVSQILTRAASELPLRPVRFPLLGEYQDTFSGEEFVTWLQESVKEFTGSLDLAEDAARALTERDGLLRRLGELGNQFEGSDDAFYQFRQKAFDLEVGKNMEQRSSSSLKGIQAENLIKRTNNFVNLVSKALNNNPNGEPAYLRARHEAEEADKAYRVAVRKLDRHRLALEERLEETLKTLQRWEMERLRAVKTILLQYQGILANIPKALEQSNERCGTLIAAYQPESDLNALIERYRTGPFRPVAQIYESVSHDEADVVFGIDLRKWAQGGWHEMTSEEEKKDLIPPVINTMLNALEEAYDLLPTDLEKRKSWIYEVPLPSVHQLREALNAVPLDQSFSVDLFKEVDAPVIASTIKLWMLELDPPLATYEGWEDFRKLYPVVGSSITKQEEVTEDQRISHLGAALQRIPRVHLHVLDALVRHLKNLIDSTSVLEESNEVYITKLALSLGRTIIRPRLETEISIQDRHPTLLFTDLINNYESILPPTIARKKRESERKVPIRKRTAPVDMRLSRSRISFGADAKQLLVAQQVAQNPTFATSKSPDPSQQSSLSTPTEQHERAAPPPPPTDPVHPPKMFVPPPPPPPLHSVTNSEVPPTSLDAVIKLNDPSLRPSFKEPAPDLDDLPPRPMFKDPPPEVEEYTPPPMPKFVDPPIEENELQGTVLPTSPAVSSVPSPPKMNVLPSIARKSLNNTTGRNTPPNVSITSRSPSPEDVVLGSGKTTISRSGSTQSTGVRGPRLAPRGPPTRRGGAVASAIANLNRNSVAGPGSSTSPSPNRFSATSPTRRPSSVLGRSAALSRRTMASDAEDDIVEKK
ncbi:hypothetical protein AMATHDRAFT_58092 [Amanita thiersii Skay4041]|uniref:Rho-GAP domain-containing protein n=1 Tax=Amanita thiersii Skay4041 TaxID=703135 RepID=A0A2A9NVR9_9AGAR|nr:hypothetical protein AMATHDRAFT_58092 [Amanita thiersii Skay4041]